CARNLDGYWYFDVW
nr:immunoglobulin heavy chain junction region [Mus musculus]